jgi:hypothetical protein
LAAISTAVATTIAPDESTAISDHFPSVNGEVFSIASVSDLKGNGTIYIAGAFTQAGGSARNNAAAFDIATGALTSWNPNVNGPVRALILSGGVAYLGGEFSQVGGQARNNLASVNTTDGAVRDWNPNVDGEVRAIAFAAGNLCIGGNFSTVSAQSRSHLAGFDSTLALLPWNPAPDGNVTALEGIGARLYLGGEFQNIASSARPFAAAIDTLTGSLTDWNPAPNGIVRAFAHDGPTIFAGGDFTEIGGHSVAYAAALDEIAGAAANWNARLNGSVYALHYFSRALYLGGDFTMAGAVSRPRLASMDSATAWLFPWNPGADATVRAIKFQGGDTDGLGRDVTKTAVLLGGAFSAAGGAGRQGFAAVRDPMWSNRPYVKVTRINGKSAKKSSRGYYYTARNRITFSGIAGGSHTVLDSVTIGDNARHKKLKIRTALGTTYWRITLRLRSQENAFVFVVKDKFYDFPLPYMTSSGPINPVQYVYRLRPGEKPPRQ